MADGVVVNRNQYSVDNDSKDNIGTVYTKFGIIYWILKLHGSIYIYIMDVFFY